MKDNEKNLSNEAAETVAGGWDWFWKRKKPKDSTWSESQKDYVRNNFGRMPGDVEDIFSRVNPTGFVELADSTGLFTQDKLNELKKGLDL